MRNQPQPVNRITVKAPAAPSATNRLTSKNTSWRTLRFLTNPQAINSSMKHSLKATGSLVIILCVSTRTKKYRLKNGYHKIMIEGNWRSLHWKICSFTTMHWRCFAWIPSLKRAQIRLMPHWCSATVHSVEFYMRLHDGEISFLKAASFVYMLLS